MNMFGGMDFIVLAVLIFVVVFFAAWLSSPALRAWIERPKYRFLADVEDYDRAQKAAK
jgi:hypothetical protein